VVIGCRLPVSCLPVVKRILFQLITGLTHKALFPADSNTKDFKTRIANLKPLDTLRALEHPHFIFLVQSRFKKAALNYLGLKPEVIE
jgi:hypothetical protein